MNNASSPPEISDQTSTENQVVLGNVDSFIEQLQEAAEPKRTDKGLLIVSDEKSGTRQDSTNFGMGSRVSFQSIDFEATSYQRQGSRRITTKSIRIKNNENRISQSVLRPIIEEETFSLDDEDFLEKQQLHDMLLSKYETQTTSAKDHSSAKNQNEQIAGTELHDPESNSLLNIRSETLFE